MKLKAVTRNKIMRRKIDKTKTNKMVTDSSSEMKFLLRKPRVCSDPPMFNILLQPHTNNSRKQARKSLLATYFVSLTSFECQNFL